MAITHNIDNANPNFIKVDSAGLWGYYKIESIKGQDTCVRKITDFIYAREKLYAFYNGFAFAKLDSTKEWVVIDTTGSVVFNKFGNNIEPQRGFERKNVLLSYTTEKFKKCGNQLKPSQLAAFYKIGNELYCIIYDTQSKKFKTQKIQ